MTTRTVSTPWGKAARIEQVSVSQRAGDDRFASVVELLETERGERLVRFAFTTHGTARRGPVTFRQRDLERLWVGLARSEGLAALLMRREGAS